MNGPHWVAQGLGNPSANATAAATLNVDSGDVRFVDLVINGDTTIDVADCKVLSADTFTIEASTTVTKNGTGVFTTS